MRRKADAASIDRRQRRTSLRTRGPAAAAATTPALRRMVAETSLDARRLVLPVFVREGLDAPRPIGSMPGVVQHTRSTLLKAVAEAAELGLGGVMLFGIPDEKDATGSRAVDPGGILNLAINDVVAEVGDALTVMSDLCLDEFTDHGHCGVLTPDGRVDNDRTLEVYAEMALAHADAGVDMVGPSGMMDGQVAAIRAALDAAGHTDVSILAYSAKYASAFFGPFREAVDSSLQGDRRTYQQDPANAVEGVREALLDVEQGADIVMVKPALAYLGEVLDLDDDPKQHSTRVANGDPGSPRPNNLTGPSDVALLQPEVRQSALRQIAMAFVPMRRSSVAVISRNDIASNSSAEYPSNEHRASLTSR